MSTPAGWYPDPAEPSQARWWNGSGWSDQTAPRSAVAGGGAPVPAPRYGEYAPVPPVTPAPAREAASAALPSWPAATPPVSERAPLTSGLATGTPWIWLSIVAAHLQVVALFFVDWQEYVDMLAAVAADPTMDPNAAPLAEWSLGVTGLGALGLVFVSASVLFAFLDHRALAARGIRRPFPWAFAFLAFVVTLASGVYVIGRTVVVRRQTGGGLAPLWGWIAAEVLVVVVTVGVAMSVVGHVLDAIPA